MTLAHAILTQAHGSLTPNRRNAVITTLLLVAEADEMWAGYRGLKKGLYRLDEALVEQVFNGLSLADRFDLAIAPAFSKLKPERFRKLYLSLWRAESISVGQRWCLASSLESFLWDHPEIGYRYAEMLSTLMRDRVEEVALRGLAVAGFMGKGMTVADARLLLKHLQARSFKTMSTLNTLTELYRRWTVSPPTPEVRELLSSATATQSIRECAADRDEDIRACARYCVKAMRQALGAAGRRRLAR